MKGAIRDIPLSEKKTRQSAGNKLLNAKWKPWQSAFDAGRLLQAPSERNATVYTLLKTETLGTCWGAPVKTFSLLVVVCCTKKQASVQYSRPYLIRV